MRDVKDVRVPLAAIAGRIGVGGRDDLPAFFALLLARTGVKEVRVDGGDLVYPSFVPIEPLLSEALAELQRSGARIEPCGACRRLFDVEHDDGIFADPRDLRGFLCRKCAESMSAWTYYTERLRLP